MRRRSHLGYKAVALCSLALAALVSIVSSAGFAQQGDGQSGIRTLLREVDSREPSKATLTFMHAKAPSKVSLQVGGKEVAVGDVVPMKNAAGSELGVVFVVDTSPPMDESGALQEARAAIEQIAGQLARHQWVGIVQAGDRARVVVDLTRSSERIRRGVDRMAASKEGGARLWGALDVAGRLFEKHSELQANVVVVSTGTDRAPSQEKGGSSVSVEGRGCRSFRAGRCERTVPNRCVSKDRRSDGRNRWESAGSEPEPFQDG
jgi:Mg-chelatase subunit ChlD